METPTWKLFRFPFPLSKIGFYLFFFLLWQVVAFAGEDFSLFSPHQDKWTKGEIEGRLNRLLHPNSPARGYFELSNGALVLFDELSAKGDRKELFRLRLNQVPCEKSKKEPKKGLLGTKIAIDPGHFGGVYAHLEDRFIDMAPLLKSPNPIRFDEGSIAYLTAAYLKLLLEKEGAIVMLTREGIGKGAYPLDFFSWVRENPDLWFKDVSLKTLFTKHYNPLDLRARAEKINRFSPDLSVIIHYNAVEPGKGISSNHFVAAENFNLVFVPGAFGKRELSDTEGRCALLRLLLTDDVSQSISLARSMMKQFGEILAVPAVCSGDGATYLDSVCLKIEEGIYARNLAMTRLVQGPVVYGETLVQNNLDECLNLSRTDFVIEGVRCSSRLKEVAQAYFAGIVEFLSN